MTYYPDFSNTPAGEALRAIQVRGRAKIKDLATDLGVTASAVRQHLLHLQAQGAIRAEVVREGVGRPYYVYSLTPQAHNLFRQDYGELAALLLQEMAMSQGPDAFQDVLRRVSDRLAAMYQGQVKGRALAERLADWAALLDQRGVAVEIVRTEQGYLLREYGCLYHNVAAENRAACEMERQIMARLLVSGVKRTQCVLDGDRGCEFLISESAAQEPASLPSLPEAVLAVAES
jgi:predicted ArsR family transcriptional regulator